MRISVLPLDLTCTSHVELILCGLVCEYSRKVEHMNIFNKYTGDFKISETLRIYNTHQGE